MAVCNALVYNGRLQCGSDEIAERYLQLPFHPAPTPASQPNSAWMDAILCPELPVLFLDTDGCGDATESVVGGQICNRFEANLVARLIMKLRMVH